MSGNKTNRKEAGLKASNYPCLSSHLFMSDGFLICFPLTCIKAQRCCCRGCRFDWLCFAPIWKKPAVNLILEHSDRGAFEFGIFLGLDGHSNSLCWQWVVGYDTWHLLPLCRRLIARGRKLGWEQWGRVMFGDIFVHIWLPPTCSFCRFVRTRGGQSMWLTEAWWYRLGSRRHADLMEGKSMLYLVHRLLGLHMKLATSNYGWLTISTTILLCNQH